MIKEQDVSLIQPISYQKLYLLSSYAIAEDLLNLNNVPTTTITIGTSIYIMPGLEEHRKVATGCLQVT